MRSITTFIPTTLIIGAFLALALLIAPASAKADTIDDLIARVQSAMEEMAKIQADLQALKANQSTTQASAGTPTPTVAGASTFKFTESLEYGADNDDIFKIQQLLKTDSEIYPEGTVSGFFGPKTENAIRNLQTRFGLDPVGVIGPATTALLERLISQMNADGTYPSDILDPARPTGTVAGESTSAPTTENPIIQNLLNQVAQLEAQKGDSDDDNDSSSSNSQGITRIRAEVDDGEALVKIFYNDDDTESFWANSDEDDEIIEETADRTGLSESEVEDLIDFEKYKSNNKSSDDADDIDEILIDVDVEDGVAEITVVFEDEDEDEDEFEVEEVDLEDIIEEVADELDIDEDDVRDLMDVDYNVDEDDIDEINAVIDGGETEVTVELESGDDFEFVLEEDDEDDIIEEIADLLDIDEDEIEDLIDIDEE